MKNKVKQCSACGVIEGGTQYHEVLSPYRGHNLCCYCIRAWQKLEGILGREVDWREFLNPIFEQSKAQRVKVRRDKVKQFISQGLKCKEIAKRLHISMTTVATDIGYSASSIET